MKKEGKHEKLIRQGDVILKRIDKIPEKASLTNNFVLAEGEATGHKHLLSGKAVTVLETIDRKFINAGTTAILMHEEHKQVMIPKGLYEVKVQREYDPVQERKVMD
jgi:hypothetical protein